MYGEVERRGGNNKCCFAVNLDKSLHDDSHYIFLQWQGYIMKGKFAALDSREQFAPWWHNTYQHHNGITQLALSTRVTAIEYLYYTNNRVWLFELIIKKMYKNVKNIFEWQVGWTVYSSSFTMFKSLHVHLISKARIAVPQKPFRYTIVFIRNTPWKQKLNKKIVVLRNFSLRIAYNHSRSVEKCV